MALEVVNHFLWDLAEETSEGNQVILKSLHESINCTLLPRMNEVTPIYMDKYLNLSLLDPHTLGSENHEYAHPCDFLKNYFLKEVKCLKMSDLLTTRAYKRSPRLAGRNLLRSSTSSTTRATWAQQTNTVFPVWGCYPEPRAFASCSLVKCFIWLQINP